MFGLTLRTESHARSKNANRTRRQPVSPGQSWTQFKMLRWGMSGLPGSMSLIAIAKMGTLKTKPTRKRRLMSSSSGFGPSSWLTVSGSKAMPQYGHGPACSERTSGCIGQVYTVPAGARGIGSGAVVFR